MKYSASIKDQTIPGSKWAFDANVTTVFDDMLARSIPQYETMRELTTALAVEFAQDHTTVLDLGCSRGTALEAIIRERGILNRYVGVEISEPMIAAARETLAGFIQTGYVDIQALDLRSKFPRTKTSVVLSVLSLQFIPIEYRQRIVQNVYDSLLPGGAFILVEKLLGSGAKLDTLFVERYLDHKRKSGYSDDQIERKRLSLEGVLVPITAQWNESLLRNAGFADVDCFWRWLNFAGWVAVKR
jgi:tRNA (cmo5U34)-methyltransferase